MVATTSLRTVPLAENRRWYHCKCVCVKRLQQKLKQEKFHVIYMSLANSASPLSFSTVIIVASMIVITKNLKRKQIFIMYVQASRLELASLLNGGRDSLGSCSSRTHRFYSMIAAGVVWYPKLQLCPACALPPFTLVCVFGIRAKLRDLDQQLHAPEHSQL